MTDLHCHTTASDGLVSPTDIVRQAAGEGIAVLAIADHDTVNGLDAAVRTAQQEGIYLVPAIELSIAYPSGIFHLLGYGIQYQNRAFREELGRLKRIREDRIKRILEALNEAGIELSDHDVQNELNGDVPGKPHVARALVRKGYASDIQEALRTYLNRGAPGYVAKEKIEPKAAFALIRGAGGFPVVAHPRSLNCNGFAEYDRFIQGCLDMGLAGIEAYAGIHDDEDVALFLELANQYDLVATGGSDFHGDNGSRLGYYGDGRPIPETCSRSLLQLVGH